MTAPVLGQHGILPALLDKAVDIDLLEPHPLNARTRDRRAQAAVRESLEEHGQYRTVFARALGDGRVQLLGGHGTVEQARELGWTHVAVDVHEGVSDEQAAKMVAVDNRTSDLAGYDQDRLADLLAAAGDLRGTGFERPDYDELLANNRSRAARTALTDVDAAPPKPSNPHTQVGQVWLLGEHRLAVGDGTNPDVVAAALGGQLADAYLTDPPYNVDYTGKTKDALKISEGDHQDAAGFGELLAGLFAAALEHTRPGGPAYVFHSDHVAEVFHQTFMDSGWFKHQVIIWVKDRFVLGRKDHHTQHEGILYGWALGAAHTWFGGRALTTLIDDETDLDDLSESQVRRMLGDIRAQADILRHPRPGRSTMHPTMKPVAMLVDFLERSTRPGARVLDSCAGSGSLLIAAHTAGRVAGLVELDPSYADVICRRWEEHTGVTPVLESTGQARSFLPDTA